MPFRTIPILDPHLAEVLLRQQTSVLVASGTTLAFTAVSGQ